MERKWTKSHFTYFKCGRWSSQSSGQINTIYVVVMSFWENNTIEWFVKLQKYFHSFLFAFDIERNDFWCIGSRRWPQFIGRWSNCFFIGDFIWMRFFWRCGWEILRCGREMRWSQRRMWHSQVRQMWRWRRRRSMISQMLWWRCNKRLSNIPITTETRRTKISTNYKTNQFSFS